MDFFSNLWPGTRGQPPRPNPCPAALSDTDPLLSFAGTLADNPCATVAGAPGKRPGNPTGKRRGRTPATGRQPLPSPHRALALALKAADRPLTVTELAHAMGCCVGEASKRVKAARGLVRTRREGRYRFVTLKQLSWPQWREVFGTSPATSFGAHP